MKRAKASKEGTAKPVQADSYGYGLTLNLDDEQMTKLGLDMPKVGAKFAIEAMAVVTHASQSADNGGKTRAVTLQLRKLGFEKFKGSMRDAVEEGVEDAEA
ncbi:MAG: hypothetical protein KAY22_05505 [Rhizorhabdus sp.]|uniref:capsid staple protein n=1 Tax=Rhizorhabdus sp. TaxID=1968843 RepID=UPI001B776536|nr:hypothetical protein [Rhizorhabdus sp.]MBP8231741.1 hypothetical protein [Rhizorhabdus sp.]